MVRAKIHGDDIVDGSLEEKDLHPETIEKLNFGEPYFEESSEGLTETTSIDDYIDKVIINCDLIPGIYRLNWCYSWFYSSISHNFEGRIILNDEVQMNHIEEPKDSSEEQRLWNSGFKKIIIEEAGTYSIKLQFRSGRLNKTASIMNARLDLWRC